MDKHKMLQLQVKLPLRHTFPCSLFPPRLRPPGFVVALPSSRQISVTERVNTSGLSMGECFPTDTHGETACSSLPANVMTQPQRNGR